MTQHTRKERLFAFIFSLTLVFGLAACAAPQASEQPAAGNEAAEQAAGDKAADEDVGPGGEPWANTIWSTDVPDKKPAAEDDLYLAVDYDWLKDAKEEHLAGQRGMTLTPEIQNAALAAINDPSAEGNGIKQLRIFYKQATHLKTLRKIGASEIQPYLDRIMGAQSLSELEEVLLSEDFPFDPWLSMGVSFADKRENNIATINPNMLFSEIYVDGGDPYQDFEDDPIQKESAQATVKSYTMDFAGGLTLVGVDPESVLDKANELFEFEKRYGKELESSNESNTAPYGERTGEPTAFSMDELEKAFGDFPVKALVEKEGKSASESFFTGDLKWIKVFGELWTEDNFEIIRLTSAARVLKECRYYLYPELFDVPSSEKDGAQDKPEIKLDEIADSFAYNACDNNNTFGRVIAQNYVENSLGQDTVDRLTQLSIDILDTYKKLARETTWFDETSRANVLDKLSHMTLNILAPEGGYTDYSGLKLKSSKRGGTLFSNYLRIKAYRRQMQNARIGQPALARNLWEVITPTTLNAFYDPTCNSINILPGYVLSTSYRDGMSDEELLACVGTVIGHEMSHGFDYSGSQYDAYGLRQPIFSEGDVSDFIDRRDKLSGYYSSISYNTEGDKVHGEEKCIEAAADLCGVQVVCAYAKGIDGFDYKRFFEAHAELWGTSYPARVAAQLIADPHPLPYLRVNVNAQMQDEFYEAFDVDADDNMYLAPEDRVAFWGEAA